MIEDITLSKRLQVMMFLQYKFMIFLQTKGMVLGILSALVLVRGIKLFRKLSNYGPMAIQYMLPNFFTC